MAGSAVAAEAMRFLIQPVFLSCLRAECPGKAAETQCGMGVKNVTSAAPRVQVCRRRHPAEPIEAQIPPQFRSWRRTLRGRPKCQEPQRAGRRFANGRKLGGTSINKVAAMHAPLSKQNAKLSKWLTLAAMSLGYGVVQLDVTIVNVAISSIGTSFGGGVSALQWVVSAYTIAFAALILTAGALGDRIGAKRVFMAGFAMFTLASLGCSF